MSYQSTIDLIMGQMNSAVENEIYRAVRNVGIYVDKEELIKALRYDREQYQKGYKDRDTEIVRCRDCRNQECEGRNGMIVCDLTGESHRPEWFCADGEMLI